MWDEEVDVVSVGAGLGGLACAIAAADAGLEVFVATPPPAGGVSPLGGSRGWLPAADALTHEYFTEISAELAPIRSRVDEIDAPTRVVHEEIADPANRRVETFVGSRLRDWGARCLASSYGLLFTRVADWPSTTMRTAEGESIEVLTVGVVDAEQQRRGWSLADWLTAAAGERDIEPYTHARLQRIVFEEGLVTGVVVDTPEGPYAVRARIGVAVTHADDCAVSRLPLEAGSQVALVSVTASRFARVEVLRKAEPRPKAQTVCHETSRHIGRYARGRADKARA